MVAALNGLLVDNGRTSGFSEFTGSELVAKGKEKGTVALTVPLVCLFPCRLNYGGGRTLNGFGSVPWKRVSKCRCGPVERPVEPAAAMTPP